ncbi:MAG: YkgJ family cysteine cluster protein [Candidatus Lokiarchaeota archaeon]|nr:YkgJ family cysteine cluster protein [Candidatus Lokiarchaeota archaeon]
MKDICKDCGKCCIETEMLLSSKDIARIKKNNPKHLKIANFVRKTEEGFNQLKNVKGYCVFFDRAAKMCTIYDERPQGCRFYPLIYDSDKKLCVLDHECPRPKLFYPNKKYHVKTCKKIVRFLEKQVLFTKL